MRLQALQVGRARAGVSQEGAAPGLRLGVGGRCDLGAGSRWTAPLPLSPHPAQKQPPRRGAPPTATCRDAPSLPASSHGLTLAARKVMPQLDSTFRTPRFCSFSDGGVGSPLPRRHQDHRGQAPGQGLRRAAGLAAASWPDLGGRAEQGRWGGWRGGRCPSSQPSPCSLVRRPPLLRHLPVKPHGS